MELLFCECSADIIDSNEQKHKLEKGKYLVLIKNDWSCFEVHGENSSIKDEELLSISKAVESRYQLCQELVDANQRCSEDKPSRFIIHDENGKTLTLHLFRLISAPPGIHCDKSVVVSSCTEEKMRRWIMDKDNFATVFYQKTDLGDIIEPIAYDMRIPSNNNRVSLVGINRNKDCVMFIRLCAQNASFEDVDFLCTYRREIDIDFQESLDDKKDTLSFKCSQSDKENLELQLPSDWLRYPNYYLVASHIPNEVADYAYVRRIECIEIGYDWEAEKINVQPKSKNDDIENESRDFVIVDPSQRKRRINTKREETAQSSRSTTANTSGSGIQKISSSNKVAERKPRKDYQIISEVS